MAVLDFYPDATMLAIRHVESSAGRDCRESSAGAITCWQIKRETARWVGCSAGWDSEPDGPSALACARLVRSKGMALCARWDVYGEAWFYYRGECMPLNAKPRGYEMDVARARLKYL